MTQWKTGTSIYGSVGTAFLKYACKMLCLSRSTIQSTGVSFKTLKLYFLPHSDNNAFIPFFKVYDRLTGVLISP